MRSMLILHGGVIVVGVIFSLIKIRRKERGSQVRYSISKVIRKMIGRFFCRNFIKKICKNSNAKESIKSTPKILFNIKMH